MMNPALSMTELLALFERIGLAEAVAELHRVMSH